MAIKILTVRRNHIRPILKVRISFSRLTLILFIFLLSNLFFPTPRLYAQNKEITHISQNFNDEIIRLTGWEHHFGDTLKCFVSGDEFYYWLHDKDGYTITFNPKAKYWVYADKQGDDLIPTNLIAGIADPAKARIVKWLLPNWNNIKSNYLKRPKTIIE